MLTASVNISVCTNCSFLLLLRLCGSSARPLRFLISFYLSPAQVQHTSFLFLFLFFNELGARQSAVCFAKSLLMSATVPAVWAIKETWGVGLITGMLKKQIARGCKMNAVGPLRDKQRKSRCQLKWLPQSSIGVLSTSTSFFCWLRLSRQPLVKKKYLFAVYFGGLFLAAQCLLQKSAVK